MENVRNVPPLHDIPHRLDLLLPMVMIPPRKVQSAQGLDPQPRQGTVFVQQGPQCLLMRRHAENHIPQIEQTSKEEFGLVVVSDVVEAGVGGVGCVAQASGSVVLEEDVEVVEGVGFVVEEFEGVLVPDEIDVLKENVMSEAIDELNGDDFGPHHGSEAFVSVHSRLFFRHLFKYLLIVKGPQPQPRRDIVHPLIRREHQHLLPNHVPKPPCLRRTNEIDQQIALTRIAHHDHHGIIPPGALPRQGSQLGQRPLQPLEIRDQQFLILKCVLILRSRELVLPIGLQASPHGMQRQMGVEFGVSFGGVHAQPALNVVGFVIAYDGGALVDVAVVVGEYDVEARAVGGGGGGGEVGEGGAIGGGGVSMVVVDGRGGVVVGQGPVASV
mmetsp:Transcript_13123/g.25707  ORF Transcript_13123/g.25707 Transcript_13123/m.25707 type:complete len:384 (+) Transcript_13123:632-1783(+)